MRSMRSLSFESCVTQLLNDRVDEVGATRFRRMVCRRVEGEGVVALKASGKTAERRRSAIRAVWLP